MKFINFSINKSRLWFDVFLWRMGYVWLFLVFCVLTALLVKLVFLPLQLRSERAEREAFSQLTSQRLNADKDLPLSAFTANEAAVLEQLKTVCLTQEAVSDVLRRIVQIAQNNGVALTQSQFQMHSHSLVGFRQLQVVFPIHGNYPQMRKFVEQVLLENPGVSLDQLLIRRETVDKNQAEIELRLSLWIYVENPDEASL
ncbi:hypothetical protein HC248_02237 [Polaromonas vacuolata]|uniref:Uncharacterized protein n=2 Tax=Polaromonas vacuolata TaxID=37448 RepID=A0A6H2HBS9_9BURK|nr:hypothetical protein HC248_02237 [Polaromonas vacuolata]